MLGTKEIAPNTPRLLKRIKRLRINGFSENCSGKGIVSEKMADRAAPRKDTTPWDRE